MFQIEVSDKLNNNRVSSIKFYNNFTNMFVEVYYVMGWQWLPSIPDDPQVRGVISNLPQVFLLKRSCWSRARCT
jgi:hypothetical protein